MNELIGLIEKWATMAPDECRLVCTEDTIYAVGGMEVDTCSSMGKYEQAIIQWATQEAIEARGWDIVQNSKQDYLNKPRTWWAYVEYFEGAESSYSLHSPAAALLAAYLESLSNLSTMGNS